MGLSVHYSGSFNPAASLQEMIDEATDIAATFNWTYHVFETQFPQLPFNNDYDGKIYGISFTPPECETVFLCFLSNGKISCPSRLRFWGKESASRNESLLYLLSVKTQFAGMHAHILLIRLLKYLSGKYFIHFQLSDEGLYWETGDEKLLKEKFDLYNSLLDNVSHALESIPMNSNESLEAYFSRILKQRKKK